MTSAWNQGALWSGGAGADSDQDRWATPLALFADVSALLEVESWGLDAAALACNRKVAAYLGPDHPEPRRRDALTASWSAHSGGRPVWCNPPYSQAGRFAQVARSEAEQHGVVVALLVFARTDTRWWWLHVLARDPKNPTRRLGMCAADILWKPGRVSFLDPLTGEPRKDKHGRPQSAPAPSVLIVYRPGYDGDWPRNGVLP